MSARDTPACWLVLSVGLALDGGAAGAEAPVAQPIEASKPQPEAAAKAQPQAAAADPSPPAGAAQAQPAAAEPAPQPGLAASSSVEKAPGDAARARACFSAAQAAYLAGRLEEARQGFECAYAELPSPELAWNLARVFERTGNVEQGVRFYREYLERSARISPRERRNVEARIKALRDLQARQAVQLKAGPASPEALGSEARAFFQRGLKFYRGAHYAAAAAAFSTALQLSEAPELHYNLAMTSQQLSNLRDAYDHYAAYLAALPAAADRPDVEARMASLREQLP